MKTLVLLLVGLLGIFSVNAQVETSYEKIPYSEGVPREVYTFATSTNQVKLFRIYGKTFSDIETWAKVTESISELEMLKMYALDDLAKIEDKKSPPNKKAGKVAKLSEKVQQFVNSATAESASKLVPGIIELMGDGTDTDIFAVLAVKKAPGQKRPQTASVSFFNDSVQSLSVFPGGKRDVFEK